MGHRIGSTATNTSHIPAAIDLRLVSYTEISASMSDTHIACALLEKPNKPAPWPSQPTSAITLQQQNRGCRAYLTEKHKVQNGTVRVYWDTPCCRSGVLMSPTISRSRLLSYSVNLWLIEPGVIRSRVSKAGSKCSTAQRISMHHILIGYWSP